MAQYSNDMAKNGKRIEILFNPAGLVLHDGSGLQAREYKNRPGSMMDPGRAEGYYVKI